MPIPVPVPDAKSAGTETPRRVLCIAISKSQIWMTRDEVVAIRSVRRGLSDVCMGLSRGGVGG